MVYGGILLGGLGNAGIVCGCCGVAWLEKVLFREMLWFLRVVLILYGVRMQIFENGYYGWFLLGVVRFGFIVWGIRGNR